MNFETALLLLPGLIIGLTFHEAAHALSAKLLGDRNPERMGRISLNPFKHLSPLGTLAIFILGFGWGRPVQVNILNFKRPKLYYLLSSLAGPFANILLSGIAFLGLYIFSYSEIMRNILEFIYVINGILAIVNLIPIPPLDGSKIWPCIIPGLRPVISRKFTIIWLVIVIVLLYTGVIGKAITFVVDLMAYPLRFIKP